METFYVNENQIFADVDKVFEQKTGPACEVYLKHQVHSKLQAIEAENAELKAKAHCFACDKIITESKELKEALEALQSANAVLKSEKSSLMRSLSQYCGDA